jgi:dUTP pyrophosphatase
MDKTVKIKFKKLDPRAIVPKYQDEGASGFDFHCVLNEDYVKRSFLKLLGHSQEIVSTGLACEIPDGYEIQVRPRSGLAFKNQITITNSPGTIDSSYRGEIKVSLHNLGDETLIINSGDRIAQGVLCIVPKASITEVDELSETERGSGGFGSTGK